MTGYVDPVAVERACLGDRVRLRPIERRAAVHRLTASGASARSIAQLLGVTTRAVVRCRAAVPVVVSPFG